MKKIALPLLVLLLINSAFSQWSQISTVNTSRLNAVKFFNEYTGITAGTGGIWRSTNSGVNWTQVLSGVNMNSVSFPDNNTGYAVGDSGTIYKTINNGLNWSSQFFNTTNNLYGVSFFNVSTGHIVGQNGIILRTVTGGTNWFSQVNPIPEDLYTIIMTSSMYSCGVGSFDHERFISTGNGGYNWSYTINVGGNSLKSLSIVGTTVEVVGTNGIIRRSTNNGGTWTLISSGTTTQLNGITFSDNLTGYIVGNNALILKSTNSGLNWIQEPAVTGNHLRSLSFINSSTGWVVGQNGIVLRTGIPVGLKQIGNNIPSQIKLYQNYPNPFNPETNIKFDLADDGYVKLSLYDIKGCKISTIIDLFLEKGVYIFKLNLSFLSSGIYFYKLNYINNFKTYNENKKCIIIK